MKKKDITKQVMPAMNAQRSEFASLPILHRQHSLPRMAPAMNTAIGMPYRMIDAFR